MSDIGQEDFRVELENGKYTIIRLVGGGAQFLRHGEDWPAGNELRFTNVVHALVDRVHELESKPKGDAPAIGARAAHYGAGVQPWDHIKLSGWGPEFAAGNALKYVRRYLNKNGEDDLQKGRWYYHELVEMMNESIQTTLPTPYDHAGGVMMKLETLLTQEERKILRAKP